VSKVHGFGCYCPRCLVRAVMGLFGLVLAGCGGRLPCDEAKLSAIDAAYVANVMAACVTYDAKESCPEWPSLRALHKADLLKACPQ
jgi:hypothetical protein